MARAIADRPERARVGGSGGVGEGGSSGVGSTGRRGAGATCETGSGIIERGNDNTGESLPDPLVPADVDLRDFAFMPLDVDRLRDSGLTAKATGDEFRAAVLLWCASWHQLPAASLPDDDAELANVCGYSRSRREWLKVRAGALRNWVRCSDGRLYHSAVAGKALEAWIEKLASAISGATGNAKRWSVAIDTDRMRDQFRAAVDALRSIDPQSRTLRKKVVAILTSRSLPESPPQSGGESPPDSPPDSGSDRNRQGQGQGQGERRKKYGGS